MISTESIVNWVHHPSLAYETKIQRQIESDLHKYGTTCTGLSPEEDASLYTGQPIPDWTADKYFEYFSKELVRALTGVCQIYWRLAFKQPLSLNSMYGLFFRVPSQSLGTLLHNAASAWDLYVTDKHFTEEMALSKDNISRIMCAFHPSYVLRANAMQKEYASSLGMAGTLKSLLEISRTAFGKLRTGLETILGPNVDACHLEGKLCELSDKFEEFFVSKSLWATPKIAMDEYKTLFKEVKVLFEKLHDEVYLAEGKQQPTEEHIGVIDADQILRDKAKSRKFIRSLTKKIRDNLQEWSQSNRQASCYILDEAAPGSPYWAECQFARKILKVHSWTTDTFIQYCKPEPKRTPKNNRKAAKIRKHKRQVQQSLTG